MTSEPMSDERLAEIEEWSRESDRAPMMFMHAAKSVAAELIRELARLRSVVERQGEARDALGGCLWDADYTWEPEELINLMESVYVLLGGKIGTRTIEQARAVIADPPSGSAIASSPSEPE